MNWRRILLVRYQLPRVIARCSSNCSTFMEIISAFTDWRRCSPAHPRGRPFLSITQPWRQSDPGWPESPGSKAFLNFIQQGLRLQGALPVMNANPETFRRQSPNTCGADPRRASRHQCNCLIHQVFYSTFNIRCAQASPAPTIDRATRSPGLSSSQCSESTDGAPQQPALPN